MFAAIMAVQPHDRRDLGCGRVISIVGVAAAIANAVWHATGVRHRAIPIRLDHVIRADS